MKAKLLVVGLALMLACLVTTEVFAKRDAPARVAAVRLGELEFTAPHQSDGRSAPGYVEARDVSTDSVVWRRQIYTIIHNPHLERDVQDVFVTRLAVDAHRHILQVTNENGDTYELDLQSLEVKATHGDVVLRVGKRCRC